MLYHSVWIFSVLSVMLFSILYFSQFYCICPFCFSYSQCPFSKSSVNRSSAVQQNQQNIADICTNLSAVCGFRLLNFTRPCPCGNICWNTRTNVLQDSMCSLKPTCVLSSYHIFFKAVMCSLQPWVKHECSSNVGSLRTFREMKSFETWKKCLTKENINYWQVILYLGARTKDNAVLSIVNGAFQSLDVS